MTDKQRTIVPRPGYAQDWAPRNLDFYSRIDLDPHQVVQYRQNADANLWLWQARKPFLLTLIGLGLLIVINNWTLCLTPVMLFLGHVFLSPLKPFVVGSQTAMLTGVVGVLSVGLWIFFGCLALVLTRKAILDGLKPTHIALTDRSFLLVRLSQGSKYTIMDDIPWSSIQDVKLKRAPGNRSVRDYQIQLIEKNETESELLSFRFGDVFIPEERAYLLRCLQSMIYDFNADGLEVLQPMPERQSYTELWLRELSAPPKRDKLTPLAPGALVNDSNYRIVSKIGVGGQATVYLAQPTGLNSSVGVEVVLKEFVLPVYPDPRVRKQAAEKFQQEAEMLATLRHPRIVRFIDLFIEDHRAYLVLEKIAGQTLKDLVEREGMQPQSYVIELALQMAEILEYLHGMQPPIVHRDFTPDNIMLAEDGIKLIDFSVAQKFESIVTGSVVGKPSYLAPEQFRGKPTTQSDIYSLGATLYYLLLGCDPPAITCLHPAMERAQITAELDELIARATELAKTKRYSTIETLRRDLERLQSQASAPPV